MALSILYVGPRSGTCLQRARALEGLGHRVVSVESGIPGVGSWRYPLYRAGNRLRKAPDVFGANRAVRRRVRRERFDVLWVDRGLSIAADTLRAARAAAPRCAIVSMSLDDMLNPFFQSPRYLESLPLYDLHVTTKSYNVAELEALGARRVLFVDNAYDPDTHRPLALSAGDRERYGAEIGFVGFFEEERARAVLELARAGLRVAVHGLAWGRLRGAHPKLDVREAFLEGLEYTRAICATKINLGFLRKGNRDLQTTRTVEIPASGAFLLAERTDEHRRLFEEGREAEYFASLPELLEKCRYYLAHPAERERIAAAGRRRCLEGGYSYAARLAQVLAVL